MNLVQANTATTNCKIAEDKKNGILQNSVWDEKVKSILDKLDNASLEGFTYETFQPGSIDWKNQQGVTIQDFLEKKGYTVSLDYYYDNPFSSFTYRYDLDVNEDEKDEYGICIVPFSIRYARKELAFRRDETNYRSRVIVTCDGRVGLTLEQAMAADIEYYNKRLQDAIQDDIDSKRKAELEKEEKEKKKAEEALKQDQERDRIRAERAKLRAESEKASEENHNMVIFVIGVVVAVIGVLLMFN